MNQRAVEHAWSLFSFRGRLSRTAFWLIFGGLSLTKSLLIVAINAATGHLGGGGNAQEIAWLLVLWPLAATLVKRGRARGFSAGFTLVVLSVAVMGFVAISAGRSLDDLGVSFIGAMASMATYLYFMIAYGVQNERRVSVQDALPGGKASA